MPKVKRRWTNWVICLGHALIMLMLSWLWLGLNYNLELEDNLVRWTSLVKRILPFSETHQSSRIAAYTFVDISGSHTLIDQETGSGKDIITDRLLLDSLFRLIARASPPPQAVLCDVFFERPTPHDDKLRGSMHTVQHLIFPYAFDGSRVVLPAIPETPSAYSGYYSSSGLGLKDSFLKFHLIEEDTMTSIPLRLFEILKHKNIKKRAGLLWDKNRPMLNTIIPDIKILPVQLSDDAFNRVIPLEDFLALHNDKDIGQFFSEKIVVIGDFQTEMHTSIYDKVPGVLLLINVLESLLQGEAYVSWLQLMFIITYYTLLSYFVFFYEGGPGSLEQRITAFSYPLIGSLGSRMLGFSFGLYIVSIICYFVFNVHTDILPMATYLSTLSLIKRKWPDFRKKISHS